MVRFLQLRELRLKSMLLQLVNIIGSVSVLSAYFLASTGKVNGNSWSYIAFNMIGAVLLGAVAIYFMLYGYILLNAVWGIIGLSAIYRKVW